jgi:hypothetical protein
MVLALFPLLQVNSFAQDDMEKRVKELENKAKEESKLKISGYMQAQFRNQENHDFREGGFKSSTNLFEGRRARLGATYSNDLIGYKIEFEGVPGSSSNQFGVSVKDVYVDFKDPFTKFITLRAGLTRVTMGNEITISSTEILSPELARVNTTLIPGERDIVAMLTVKAPAKHFLNPFTLNLQLLNGNGVYAGNTNKKNFVARLHYGNNFDNLKLGVGAGTYQGGTYQGTRNVYTMDGSKFVVNSDSTNLGEYASRSYYQCELSAALKSPAGTTSFLGEFWTGEHPGRRDTSLTPAQAGLYTGDTYIRPFNGIIATLSHEIPKTNLTVAVKYDMYDPNTNVSGDEIGAENSLTNAADISFNTLGCGLIFEPTKNLRFTLWYNMVTNETSTHLDGIATNDKAHNFKEDRKDNQLWLRMQIKF